MGSKGEVVWYFSSVSSVVLVQIHAKHHLHLQSRMVHEWRFEEYLFVPFEEVTDGSASDPSSLAPRVAVVAGGDAGEGHGRHFLLSSLRKSADVGGSQQLASLRFSVVSEFRSDCVDNPIGEEVVALGGLGFADSAALRVAFDAFCFEQRSGCVVDGFVDTEPS